MALLCSCTDIFGPVSKGRRRHSSTNHRYGRNLSSLIRTKLETPVKWMEASRFSSSKESVPYTTCCECDVHCDVWYWWDNRPTAPRCTSKADGKRRLLLHVAAAPPSSSAQEKRRHLVLQKSIILHDNARSHTDCCCCQWPLVPLAIGDSGTSPVLTRYESMRLQSLHQSERTTARDPVQLKRWTYPCYRAVNTEHQQIWTR